MIAQQKKRGPWKRATLTSMVMDELEKGPADTHALSKVINRPWTVTGALLNQLRKVGYIEKYMAGIMGRKGKPAVWRRLYDTGTTSLDARQNTRLAESGQVPARSGQPYAGRDPRGAGLQVPAGVSRGPQWEEAA